MPLFGGPQSLLSDQEGGIASEQAAVWAEKWSISLRLRAKGQHATTVERHHEILRQHVHRILAQTRLEGLIVSVEDVIAEATFAKNALLQCNGATPYVALLGRHPNILSEL